MCCWMKAIAFERSRHGGKQMNTNRTTSELTRREHLRRTSRAVYQRMMVRKKFWPGEGRDGLLAQINRQQRGHLHA